MNTYEIKLLHVMGDGQKVDTVCLERAHTAEDALTQVRVNTIETQKHTDITVKGIRPWEEQGIGLCNALGMSGNWKCARKHGHGGNHSPFDADGKVPPKVDYSKPVMFGDHPDDIEIRVRSTAPHATRLRKLAEVSGTPNVATFVQDLFDALTGEKWK